MRYLLLWLSAAPDASLTRAQRISAMPRPSPSGPSGEEARPGGWPDSGSSRSVSLASCSRDGRVLYGLAPEMTERSTVHSKCIMKNCAYAIVGPLTRQQYTDARLRGVASSHHRPPVTSLPLIRSDVPLSSAQSSQCSFGPRGIWTLPMCPLSHVRVRTCVIQGTEPGSHQVRVH